MGGLEHILSPAFFEALNQVAGPKGVVAAVAIAAYWFFIRPMQAKGKDVAPDPFAALQKSDAEQDDEIADLYKLFDRHDRDIHDLKRDIAQIHRDMDRNAAYERARQEFTRPTGRS